MKHPSAELRRPLPCTFENYDYRAAGKKTLSSHVDVNHNPGRTRDFNCPLCPSRFYSKHRLRRHVQLHKPERQLKCSHCNYTTRHKSSLDVHERAVHEKSVMYSCSVPGCNCNTTQRSYLKSHKWFHEPEGRPHPFQCTFQECAFSSWRKSILTSHTEERHNPGHIQRFNCTLCPKNFASNHYLKVHIRGFHNNKKWYKCKECSFAAPSHTNLTRHCKRKHGDGNPKPVFKCRKSSYLFQAGFPHSLRNHILCHEKDPERRFPFQCPFEGCDYRRRTKAQLAPRERQHSTSRTSQKCGLCPRKCYPDSVSLRFHRFFCHNDGRYTCSVCKYPARNGSDLTSHNSICHKTGRKAKKGKAGSFRKTWTDACQCQICGHKGSDELSALMHSASHHVPIVLLNKFTLETL